MKKFLSMALALVMALSLCAAFTTQEADAAFTDSADLSNEYAIQAADVIKVIEVMDGYDDGSFRPTAGLTRQAAAKIICNMILGPTTAKALPTNANPFPDVPAGNQFAGYISYCSQQGIISGYSDGTFKPTDPLTGYAYLKMLLGALGYDANNEGFVGNNWKVNVAKIALGIGLNKGMKDELDASAQVTREIAAVCAFNTLQADMVTYESRNTLEINGVKVSMGGGKAIPETWSTSSTNAGSINREQTNGQDIVQFAERYFDKLERFPKTWDAYWADDFGRPAIRWEWKGAEVGTYKEDADASYVGNVAANTVYNDLGMSSSSSADAYFNGRYAGQVNIAKSNSNDINKGNAMMTDKIGDGTLVEAYLNDANNEVTICVMNVWAGKVTNVKAATASKNERVVLDVGKYGEDTAAGTIQDNRISRPKGITDSASKREYELPDADEGKYQEDDVVAFLYSEGANEIKEILYVLEPVEGTLTRRYDDKSLVLDGTTYKYAKNVHFDFSGTAGSTKDESGLTNKNDYIIYLDENDLVMWVEESAFSDDQYALVERIWLENSDGAHVISSVLQNAPNDPTVVNVVTNDQESSSISAPRARLRFTSGSYRDVNLNDSAAYRETRTVMENGVATLHQYVKDGYQPGQLVRFTTTSDGDYKLHTVKGANANNNGGVPYTGAVASYAVSNNTLSGFYLTDANGNVLSTISADSSTKFIVSDDGTYKTYTGIRNVPNVKNVVYGAAYCKDTLAKVVYLVTKNAGVEGSSNDIIFLAAPSVSKRIDDDDFAPHFEYNAVVKNQVTTIRVAYYVNAASSGSRLTINGITTGNGDKDKCILINQATYDGDDVLKSGAFIAGARGLTAFQAEGIKRVSGSIVDIKLDTAHTEKSLSMDDGIRVYFSDKDGNIEEIDVSDIVTDGNDQIYYVMDGGDITYMFIQEVDEDDDDDDTTGTTTVTYDLTQQTANFLKTDDGKYNVTLSGGASKITSGSIITFTVSDDNNVALTESDVAWVRLTYLNKDGIRLSATAESVENGIWYVEVPSKYEMAEKPEFLVKVYAYADAE